MRGARAVRAGGWIGAGAAAALGLVTAQAVVVALALAGAIIGGLCALLHEQSARSTGRPPRSLADATMAAAFLGLAAVLAVAGLVVVTGSAALLIVLVLLSVAAWRRYRPAAAGVHQPVAPTAGALSDTQLALAWQGSHVELARSRDPAELERVSTLRRGLLDEMERRDPAGFRRWLGDAASVTDDPTRFLGG